MATPKKKPRPSWVIRALKAAFADKPTPQTKMSKVKRKYPDALYSAHQSEAQRKGWMGRRDKGGRS